MSDVLKPDPEKAAKITADMAAKVKGLADAETSTKEGRAAAQRYIEDEAFRRAFQAALHGHMKKLDGEMAEIKAARDSLALDTQHQNG